MKRHLTPFAVIAALAAVVAALMVQPATADPGGTNHAYVCFSSQASPEVVAADDSSVIATWDTFANGYFTPWAENTVPTNTPMANGWFLTCNLATGWTEIGKYILGDGSGINPAQSPAYLQNSVPIPGLYPVIQAAAAPATTG